MATPSEGGVAGISRSGRIRKKSTKLMEMEETETTPIAGDKTITPRTKASTLTTPKIPDRNSNNKPVKLKLSFGGVAPTVVENVQTLEDLQEPFEDDDEDEEEEVDALMPPIRLKLNASKGTVELNGKLDANETAANKLFKQMTGEISPPEPLKKKLKKSASGDTFEHVHFDADEDLGESSLLEESDTSFDTDFSATNPKTPKTSIEKRDAKKPAKPKSNSKAKHEGGGDVPEKKKRTNITAYTLWSKENRPKIAKNGPGLDFAGISKKLGEVWQALPKNEKMQWKKRAARVAGRTLQGGIISTGSQPSAPFPSRGTARTGRLQPELLTSLNIENGVSKFTPKFIAPTSADLRHVDTSPFDVAAHLKILGESLTLVGKKLAEQNDEVTINGTLSLLLDSTLCALGPLMCLTTLMDETDGCPAEVHKKTLENISYIMPGI
ncbi:HMG domain-containing protein 4 [Halotydeus destructor]|nr:HMG domain-containing protein 4 [Halotydeus destructor]